MGIIDFLQHHMLACPSKALLHMDCPGCGIQRSFLCLLRGNIRESLQYHPATMLIIALALFVPVHLRFQLRHGAKIIVILQVGIAITTTVFYIYKILNHKLFL